MSKSIADVARSHGVTEKDVEDAILRRGIVAYKACEGIPTEALEADVVKRMRDKLSELAADLESELDARYPKEIREYPSEERRYQRDMSIVNEARAILKELDDA